MIFNPLFFLDPYHWAWLPWASKPFTNEIKELLLPKITDINFVETELTKPLHDLFSVSELKLYAVAVLSFFKCESLCPNTCHFPRSIHPSLYPYIYIYACMYEYSCL